MKKYFVIFFSPGTFIAEQTTKEIMSWNINEAIKLSKEIKERHGSTPYGFQFATRERKKYDFDSKETKRSNMYFLGGIIFTLEELKKENKRSNHALILNMEMNDYKRVVTNNNSWSWTQPLGKNDVVLLETQLNPK